MKPDPDQVVKQYLKGNSVNVIALNIWHTSTKAISKILHDRGVKIRKSQWTRSYDSCVEFHNQGFDKETG